MTIYLLDEVGDTLTTELPDRLVWETALVGSSVITCTATRVCAAHRIGASGAIFSSIAPFNVAASKLVVGVAAVSRLSAVISDAARIVLTEWLAATSCAVAALGHLRWPPDTLAKTVWTEQITGDSPWNDA